MKVLNEYIINDEKKIVISTNNENVNLFSEVIIKYYNNNNNIDLYSDILKEAIRPLKIILEKALNNELILNNEIKSQVNFGYTSNLFYHRSEHDDTDELDDYTEEYLLWESKTTSTWIYNDNESIYLEISPNYQWHFVDPEPNDKDFTTFAEFIKTYKPISVSIIDKSKVKRWIKQCELMLTTFEI